ncbi:MAG: TonB-dependent receptor, partial [Longimicrobiales bacterium]
MTRTQVFLACAYALIHAAPAVAQERPDSFRLKEIVATATRMATARDAAPAAVTVLYGEELRARGIRFVADALRTVPGAAVVRSGSSGGLTSLFVRGGESDYVQVLLDGIQLNEPGGSFDFGQLTLDNIERIEIVRGPVGMLYGSDAVAGVVQLFTRRGSGSPRVTAAVSTGLSARVGPQADGNYGTTAWDASAAGGVQRGDFSIGIARYDTDGAYAFNNGYDNLTLTGRGRLAIGERSEATLTTRYTDGEFHFPTNGAGALVDRNQFTSTSSFALGLEAAHAFTPAIEARLLLSLHDSDRLTDDRQDGP